MSVDLLASLSLKSSSSLKVWLLSFLFDLTCTLDLMLYWRSWSRGSSVIIIEHKHFVGSLLWWTWLAGVMHFLVCVYVSQIILLSIISSGRSLVGLHGYNLILKHVQTFQAF